MARSRIPTILTGLVGTVALLGTPMLFAATPESGADAPAMHHTQASQSAPDLKALIDKVESQYNGKVLGIEREHHGKSGIYEVELLDSNGHEQEFHVNSAGEKVTSKHHRKHRNGKHESSKHENSEH